MPSLPRRLVEVSTLEELDRLVAAGARSLAGWRLRELDLRSRGAVLHGLDPAQALFLGCRLDPATEDDLERRGALVFPVVPDVPVDPYRARLYTPDELYDGLAGAGDPGYEDTLDARAYAWAGQTREDLRASLARGLHDLAIDAALQDATRDQQVVGVMGGHDLARGSTDYRDAARLGRALSRAGLVVATGGGPGAMEAANLGAYLADADDAALEEALGMLSVVPGYLGSVGDWARCAFEVRRRWPRGPGSPSSFGVPTWFYGHEPPNVFADQVGKYFRNAIREDVLLHMCTAGTVFLPGRAGTVQELFQDACENFYAEPPSVAPMVLVGGRFWTEELPGWPLLQALAAGREMAGLVHLVDDLHDVPGLLHGPDARLQR